MTEVYAWLAEGPDRDEGICGFLNGVTWVAMVARDRAKAERLAPMAATIASASGKTVRLARFDRREDLRTIRADRPPKEGG